MEIWHFFVIFHDFVMKCVYKSTIYTFVIRDKIWTPPFVVQKCTCYFCVLGPENTPPPPYMSGTFVLAPPRSQRERIRIPDDMIRQSLRHHDFAI